MKCDQIPIKLTNITKLKHIVKGELTWSNIRPEIKISILSIQINFAWFTGYPSIFWFNHF